jgi:hypothetical protein
MVIASWIDLDPESALVAHLADTPLPAETRFILVSADDGSGDSDGTVSLVHQLPAPSVAEADRVVQVHATHTGVLAAPEVLSLLHAELSAS